MSLLSISDTIRFTKPPRGPALFFISPMGVRKAAEKVSTTTVVSSTAETVLASFAVPALTMVNQGGTRAIVAGSLRNHVTAGGTVILRAKLTVGASTITLMESSGVALSTAAASRHWQAAVLVLGTTNSTSLRSWGVASITSPTTRSLAPVASDFASQNTVVVPNSSAASTLKFTAKLSASSTGLSASVMAGWLETIS